MQHIVDIVNKYEAINLKLAEPMDDDRNDENNRRARVLLEQMDHYNAWELDHKLETAMESLRCPMPDEKISVLSGGEKGGSHYVDSY
ncbi:MAG: hypothetical protein R2766_07095 [Saprospiraceae bacterium]